VQKAHRIGAARDGNADLQAGREHAISGDGRGDSIKQTYSLLLF